MTGAVLTPPADPASVGWWAQGARPGAAHGTALLTGHTVHSGGGALDDLDRVAEGDPVVVETSRGRLDYVVARVAVLATDELARSAGRLFRQWGPGRLVVVTCEDWDGEQYRSNAVVVAVPAGE
jgi:sortase (surface protein transpeptidase)